MDIDDIKDGILNKFSLPYVVFPQETMAQKKLFAIYINKLENELILLPSTFAFSYSAIIAGLTENHVEYIAKNAPIEYKKELANSMLIEYRVKEVFEIAKLMDEDLGNESTQNQKRVRLIRRYIFDNWEVFQF